MLVGGDVVKIKALYFLSIFIEILAGSIWYSTSTCTARRSLDPRRSWMGVVVPEHCSGKAMMQSH